jgi:hypothetical protein
LTDGDAVVDASDDNREVQQRACRFLLAIILTAWFCVIGFWLGPHKILFGHFRAMKPGDFVPIAQQYCIPAVREIKIYQRDHGHLPTSARDMPAVFIAAKWTGRGHHDIAPNGMYLFCWFDGFHTEIDYDFTPGREAWSVHGPFVNGPLALPPVTLEPNAKSAYGP